MNKKGFTLIELLAVIIILAIITVIAIPIVNNIVKEAKQEAFNRTVSYLTKVAEDTCENEKISGKEVTYTYTITNGKLDHPLEIKGELPDSGTITLDESCHAIVDVKKDDLNVGEEEPPLIKQTIGTYMCNVEESYYSCPFVVKYPTVTANNGKTITLQNDIVNVKFVKTIDVPENAVYIMDDVSESFTSNGKAGNIKMWMVPNSTNNTVYDLYFGSNNMIYGNPDSLGLFYNLRNVVSYDFTNFSTKYIQDYSNMFSYNKKLTQLDLSSFDTSNATNMSFMFGGNDGLSKINLSSFNTEKVTNMAGMFYFLSLQKLNLSMKNPGQWNEANFNTSNVTDMFRMFHYSYHNELDISGFDTSKVKDMSYMFYQCKRMTKVNFGDLNTSNVTDMTSMFNESIKLTSLDLSSFDTRNAILTDMFKNTYLLNTINYSASKWKGTPTGTSYGTSCGNQTTDAICKFVNVEK